MFKNLRELIATMPDEKTCRQYLAKHRWNGKVVCPYCKHEKCYSIENGKRWKCADSKCYKRFTVTVGTIFEASNIPLNKWFPAIYLCTAHKRGISSYQLAKDIGVTQKTGWFMLHRIREILRTKEAVLLGANAPVEADETFIGGKYANMHGSKRKKMLENGDSLTNKTTVLGIVERGGNLVAKVMPKRKPYQLAVTVAETVVKNATLITDSTNAYQRIVSSYKHLSVNHTISEYVKGNAHTNTIEGAFSHFKRSIIGSFFHISPKHTQRYCDEFAAKYNSRKISDADRFVTTISNSECRLKYKTLVAEVKEPTEDTVIIEERPKNRNKGILQIKDGELIGHYKTLANAAKITNVDFANIRKVLIGKKHSAGGFIWIYA